MRLKSGFVSHDLNGKQVLVSAGSEDFAGLVRSNETAAFVIDCLKQDTSPEQIVEAMAHVYDAPHAKLEQGVVYVLETLRSVGALEE